jgi:glycosyltransferase involved in cell wall biosynthesis
VATISLLLPDLGGGGVERVSVVLAQEFARQGHEIEFVLMQAKGDFLAEAERDFRVIDLAVPRARNLAAPLARYLRQRRPDALLVGLWPLTVIAPVAQLLSGHRCKVLISEHNTLSIQYGDWGWLHHAALRTSMAIGYRQAACRVGVSAGVVMDVAALSGLHPDAFNVIHNPIPHRLKPSDDAIKAAETLWSSPPGARIVTVGSMKAQKNHSLLLRAFARVEIPDAKLMFVGDGAGRDELVALALELGVADRVILAGFHSDPTPFYSTADLFVLSSDYEGFGNVIVEALSFGVPVVSTDCPSGPAEILENGRFGKLVPVGDEPALASAIWEALRAPWNRDLLEKRAEEFSPEKAAANYLQLLGLEY